MSLTVKFLLTLIIVLNLLFFCSCFKTNTKFDRQEEQQYGNLEISMGKEEE